MSPSISETVDLVRKFLPKAMGSSSSQDRRVRTKMYFLTGRWSCRMSGSFVGRQCCIRVCGGRSERRVRCFGRAELVCATVVAAADSVMFLSGGGRRVVICSVAIECGRWGYGPFPRFNIAGGRVVFQTGLATAEGAFGGFDEPTVRVAVSMLLGGHVLFLAGSESRGASASDEFNGRAVAVRARRDFVMSWKKTRGGRYIVE